MAEPTFRCTACGRGYRWKPALAGKRTTCKCGAALVVPDQPEAPDASEPDDGPIPLAESPDAIAFAARAASATAAAASGSRTKCINCNAPLKPGVVICVRCGTNQLTGQKIDTQRGEELVDPDAGADAAEPFDPRSLGEVSRGSERERTRKLGGVGDKDAAYEGRGMAMVEAGLWCELISIVAAVVMVIGGLVAVFFVKPDVVVSAITIGAYAEMLLTVLAYGLLLAVPAVTGFRWLIVVAVACALAEFGLELVSGMPGYFEAVTGLVGFLGLIFFLVFLKQLAEFFGFPEVTEKADKVVGVVIALTVGSFLVLIPLFLLQVLVAVLMLGLAIYGFVLYISLLIDLINSVRYRRHHVGEG